MHRRCGRLVGMFYDMQRRGLVPLRYVPRRLVQCRLALRSGLMRIVVLNNARLFVCGRFTSLGYCRRSDVVEVNLLFIDLPGICPIPYAMC